MEVKRVPTILQKSQGKSATPKRGRPSKLVKVSFAQVEALAGYGHKDEEIATILGVSERTLNYWKKKPEFLQAIKRGKLKADSQIVKTLYQKATEGDTTAIIFWLKNRRPDLWHDRHDVEHSGSVALTVVSAVPRPEKEK